MEEEEEEVVVVEPSAPGSIGCDALGAEAEEATDVGATELWLILDVMLVCVPGPDPCRLDQPFSMAFVLVVAAGS